MKVSYSKGSTPLQDLSGNQANNISSYTVTNSSDTTLPKPTSGTVSNNTITVYFSEGLSAMPSVQDAYNQFTVFVGGSSRSIKNVVAGGMAATITLDSIVSDNAPVYVNYTPVLTRSVITMETLYKPLAIFTSVTRLTGSRLSFRH